MHPFLKLRNNPADMFFPCTCFLTEMVQQIHSLRASGVISSHADSALGSDDKAFRRSVGSSCATPPEIFLLISSLYAYREALGSSAAVQHRKFASLNVRLEGH